MKAFTIKNVEQMLPSFQAEIAKQGWKGAFERFKGSCRKNFKNVFVAENPHMQAAQIVYLHPVITNGWSREQIRSNTVHVPHQSVCFEVPSGKILHSFGPKSYSYAITEQQELINDTVSFATHDQIRIQPIYYGVTFTATYINEQWTLGCRSMIKANECTFGGQVQLMTAFTEALQARGQSLADLDTNIMYTFNLCSNAYAPVQVKDTLFLLETSQQPAVAVGEAVPFEEFTQTAEQTIAQKIAAVCGEKLSDSSVAALYYDRGILLVGYRVEMGFTADGKWEQDFVTEIDSPFGSLLSDFQKPEIMKTQTLQQFFEASQNTVTLAIKEVISEKQRQKDLSNAFAIRLIELKRAEALLLQQCSEVIASFRHHAGKDSQAFIQNVTQAFTELSIDSQPEAVANTLQSIQ